MSNVLLLLVAVTKHYLYCNAYFSYGSRNPNLNSETFHYKRGAGQVFQQSGFVIDPSAFNEDEVSKVAVVRLLGSHL